MTVSPNETIADPGRIHHCMRLIGLAEKALELACRRSVDRVAFGKPLVPNMALDVIDMAFQLPGGAGMTDDVPLAAVYAGARALRPADGPDEVHLGLVARLELQKYGLKR